MRMVYDAYSLEDTGIIYFFYIYILYIYIFYIYICYTGITR